MKKILILTLAIGMVCALTGCKTEEDGPKNQSATINNLFGKNISATVQGYLTDSEWKGVAGKIETALNNRYDAPIEQIVYIRENLLEPAFSQTGGVTIIVEKDPSYANYSATYGGKIIHINFAILNDAAALDLALYQGTRVISGNPIVPEQG